MNYPKISFEEQRFKHYIDNNKWSINNNININITDDKNKENNQNKQEN